MVDLAQGPVRIKGTVDVNVVSQGAVPAWKTGRNADVDTPYEGLAGGAASGGTSVPVTAGVYIRNSSTTQQVLTFSSDAGVTDGFTLRPGEWSPFVPCTDLNQLAVKSDVNNGSLEYMGF